MADQLSLPTISDVELWAQLLEVMRSIVRERGPKEVTYALDVSGSELANALAERNRCELKLRHLPYFLRARLNDDLPRLIVEHCGLSLGEPRALTAAEELALIKETLFRSGPLGQAVMNEVYGRRRR